MFLIFDTETTGLPKNGVLHLLILIIGLEQFRLLGRFMIKMESVSQIKVLLFIQKDLVYHMILKNSCCFNSACKKIGVEIDFVLENLVRI